MPCGWTDNEITATMAGQVRGENTRSCCCNCWPGRRTCAHADRPGGCPLAGFGLLGADVVGRAGRFLRCCCSLSTRPFTQNGPAEYNQLASHVQHDAPASSKGSRRRTRRSCSAHALAVDQRA